MLRQHPTDAKKTPKQQWLWVGLEIWLGTPSHDGKTIHRALKHKNWWVESPCGNFRKERTYVTSGSLVNLVPRKNRSSMCYSDLRDHQTVFFNDRSGLPDHKLICPQPEQTTSSRVLKTANGASITWTGEWDSKTVNHAQQVIGKRTKENSRGRLRKKEDSRVGVNAEQEHPSPNCAKQLAIASVTTTSHLNTKRTV